MPYKHGIYANILPSGYAPVPDGVETRPVYIGTAPIQQLGLSNYSSKINKVIRITSYEDAVSKVGYSDDWSTFTLCEAIAVHFKSGLSNIGPIFVINALDPAADIKSGTKALTFTNDVAYIDAPAVLSSIDIGAYVAGTDFTAEYDGERVKITNKTNIPATGQTAAYDEIDITKVTYQNIIDSMDDIDNIYRNFNEIPNILAAPGWSHYPDVAVALDAICQNKISSKWEAICVVDIDSSESDAQTIEEAKTWKTTNSYTSKNMKVCWPKVTYQGDSYWLSTIAAYLMQKTDYENDNIPSLSASNKQIPIDGTILNDDTEVVFDEANANLLNEEGITTANYSGGIWRLWGPHMGNYSFSNLANIDSEDRSDASIRTQKYIANQFKIKFLDDVDGQLTRRLIEGIVVDTQQWLNSLVNSGHLLFGEVKFVRSNNADSDITDGDFIFDVGTTTTPVGKSITFSIKYTPTGLNSLFGGEE